MRIKTRLGNLIVEANPITEDEASAREDLSVLSTIQIDDKIYTLGTVESDEDDPLIDNSNEVVFLPTTEIQNQAGIEHDTEEDARPWTDLQGYIKDTWKLTDQSQVTTSILLPTYKTFGSVVGNFNEFQFAVVEPTNRGTFYIKYINEPNITKMLFLFTYSTGSGIYRIPDTILPASTETGGSNTNFFVKTSLSLGTTTGTAFDGGIGSALAEDVSVLKGYFNNAQANYAVKDSNGNIIHEHYQSLITEDNKINAEFIEGLPEGLYVESEILATSEHPVSSSALYDKFATKQDAITTSNKLSATLIEKWSDLANNTIPSSKITTVSTSKISGLATVATTGSYNDLKDKPNIPEEGIIIDKEWVANSTNAVESKLIQNALNQKVNTSSLNKIATEGLKAATTNSLGGIKVGNHLSIENDGTLSVDVTGINEGILDQDTADGLYVPLTRKINNKTLDKDISITKSDLSLGNVTNVSTTETLSPNNKSNITSGAVYTALQNKQDKLTAGQNIIIEDGVIKSQGQLGIYGPFVSAERPSKGDPGVIYLEYAPASSDTEGDHYIEYIWVNGAWERLGSIGVNLTDYVKTNRTIATLPLTGDITASALRAQLNLPENTKTALNNKQDKLTEGSHINIDTTNNKISVLMDNTLNTDSTGPVENKVITTALAEKQDIITADNKLSFDLIDGGPDLSGYATTSWVESQNYLTTADIDAKADKQDVEDALAEKQDTLISGTTLKTINGESLLGSGNLIIAGGGEGGDNNLGIRSVVERPEGPVISAPDTFISKIYVKQTFTEDEAYQLLYALPVLGGSGDITIRMSWIFMRVHTTIDPETNEEIQTEEGLAIIALQTFNGSDGIIMMIAPNDTTYELKYNEDTGLLTWKDSSDNLIPEYFEINGYGLDKFPDELAAEVPEAAIMNVIGIGTNNYQLMPFVWTERTDPPRLGTLTYLEEDVYPKTLLENIYLTPTKPASLATTKDLDGLRAGFVMTSERLSDIDTQLSDIDSDITNLQTNLASKQNKLTAGEGIDITNNVISATSITVDAYTKQEVDDKVQVINESLTTLSTNLTTTTSELNTSISGINESIDDIHTILDTKQATLVSGTNIKTINNQSLLGEGNITIEGGDGGSAITELFVESDDDGDMVLGLRVSEVQATIEINPSETPTATLDSIKINDIVYDCTESGGGGTNVEANPTDTATDTLTSLKVSNITYAIPTVDEEAIYESIDAKQDKLTAGDNISITNNVISATMPTIVTDYGNTLLTNVSSDFAIDFSHFYQIGDLMFAHIVGSTTKSVSSATVKVLGTLTRKPQHLHSFAYATTRGDTFTQASDGASVDTDGTIRIRLTSNASASTYTFDLSFFYCVDH